MSLKIELNCACVGEPISADELGYKSQEEVFIAQAKYCVIRPEYVGFYV